MIGILGALISAVGFGTANIVIKKSLSSLSIPQTLMMSTLSGAVCLLIFTLVSGGSEALTGALLIKAAVLAGVEVLLYLVLYKAFAVSNVTVATAVIGVYPILSTLFTVLVLSEPLAPHKFLFIALLVVGAIITSINWDDVTKDGFDKKDLVKGLGWMAGATLLHAVYFPFLGDFTATGSWPSKLLLIKIFSTVLLFIVFYVVKKQSVLPPKAKVPFTSLLGLLEVIGWAGFSWATNSSTGQTAIIIAALNSSALVTAVLAYLVLKEKLSKFQYLGILIIVASLTGLSIS
jgi:drug/metabolite transporter (DMT)-like permease